MPKIQVYESRSQVQGPVDIPRANPEMAGALTGRGMEQLGSAMMNFGDALQRRAEQSEISDVNAKLAQLQADATNEWQDAYSKADPHDKTLADRFNEGFQQKLDAMREEVSTRAGQLHFEQTAARLKAQFTRSTFVGQSELTAIKETNDLVKAFNNRSSSLLNDPSSFDMTFELNNQDIDSRVASGGLPREAAEKLRAQSNSSLAKSAVRGWIKLSPEDAIAQMKEGRWDSHIDGDLKNQLLGEAKVEINARETEKLRMEQEAKRLQAEKHDKVMSDIYTNIVSTKGGVSWKTINSTDLPYEKKLQLHKLSTAAADEKIKTNPTMFNNLFTKVMNNEINDENELVAFVGKGITVENFNFLRGEISGKRSPEGQAEAAMLKNFWEGVDSRLIKKDPLTGMGDPAGHEAKAQFMAIFYPAFQEAKKQGKTAAQLLNPESPDYLGNLAVRFYKTPQQVMKENIQRLSVKPRGTPPPMPQRRDGESPADYMKRVKGEKQ